MALTDEDKSYALAASLPLDALDRLARIHRETRQTSHLTRFLASSVHAAFLFLLMTVLVLLLARTETIGRDFCWAVMILAGVLALLQRQIRAHAALFSEVPMSTAKELRMIFLYMGFAWGAGAFLVLPATSGTLAVLLFTAVPGLTLALLLADAASFTLFLVPSGLTVIGAALIRSFPYAMLEMSLILILQWGLFTGAILRNREPDPATFPRD